MVGFRGFNETAESVMTQRKPLQKRLLVLDSFKRQKSRLPWSHWERRSRLRRFLHKIFESVRWKLLHGDIGQERLTKKVKGTVARHFRPSFFSSINPTWDPAHGPKPFCIWPNIRGKNRQYSNFSGVNDRRKTTTGISLTKFFLRNYEIVKQFKNFMRNLSGVLDDFHWFLPLSKRFARRILSHMRNGFSPWIRALGGDDWWKKNRGSKISFSPLSQRPFYSTGITPIMSYHYMLKSPVS
jgi:hypothetical protein